MSAIVRELMRRQRALAIYGFVLLGLTVLAMAAQAVDGRTIAGVNVWNKPAKFFISVAIFSLTTAWYFGYVRPERRGAAGMRWLSRVLIGAGSFELAYISWQGAHALASHFNRSTPFYAIMYALMGVGAVLLVGTTLPLAWEIARRPAAGLRRDYAAAVVTGLLLCFGLGGGFGFYMAQQTGHGVGAIGGALPIMGWNRAGGDLRAAHFLGIHAQQAIPVLGAMVGRLPGWARGFLLAAGSGVYALVTVGVFVGALHGRALL